MAFDLRSTRSSSIISTQAFQESHTIRPKSQGSQGDSYHTRDPSNDIFESIIPKLGTAHHVRSSKQLAIEPVHSGHNSRNLSSRSSHLKQVSLSSSDPVSYEPSMGEDEENSFGGLQSMFKSTLNNVGNSSESSAPSPERRSIRSGKQRVPIPNRRSSRTRIGGNSESSDAGYRDIHRHEIRHQISTTDTTAASQALAASEMSSYGTRAPRKLSVQTDRSATPPPIGRVRRRTEYDSDSGEVAHDVRPPISDAAMFLQEPPHLLPVSRRHSQASLVSQRSQRSSKTRPHHMVDRTPVHDQVQSGYETVLLPPPSRIDNRPRSRQESVRGFNKVHGNTSLHPQDEILAERSRDGASLRHSSITTSVRDRRPVSVAKRVFSDDALSRSRRLPTERQSIISHSSSTRMPDFFNYEVFRAVLRNPTTAHRLLKFSETRLCSKNIDFLNKVDAYQQAVSNLTSIMSSLHKGFISSHSTTPLDVPDDVVRSVHKDVKALSRKTLPVMENIFADMQARIEELVLTDVYPQFVRHQLALSATRALAIDRHRYAGLGDCFCLSNPNEADNPIVFASDGFAKVTGYSRPEVISQNCRLLQGLQTDRIPIARVEQGIIECRETVELILNYKKNGDPFWNLLYIAPLFNENGNLAFFIGGQINCSTTISNNADIMKVLSLSATAEVEDELKRTPAAQAPQRQGPLPSARKAFLKAFGVRVDEPKAPPGPSGMEQNVLGQMEGQDLNAQIKEFYTPYSKYLVVKADTFVISYFSEGVLETLNPANNSGLIAGQEIFRFFRQNMMGKETDYRSKVRSAIRAGNSISLELRLQTRRSARFQGDEVFATHWTPLKDVNAATHWVVIVLASTMY